MYHIRTLLCLFLFFANFTLFGNDQPDFEKKLGIGINWGYQNFKGPDSISVGILYRNLVSLELATSPSNLVYGWQDLTIINQWTYSGLIAEQRVTYLGSKEHSRISLGIGFGYAIPVSRPAGSVTSVEFVLGATVVSRDNFEQNYPGHEVFSGLRWYVGLKGISTSSLF